MAWLFHRRPGWRYDGLAVGLDNSSPWDSAPGWLQYALCSRYHGPTPTSPVNLTLPCTHVGNANRYRYVIVQSKHAFPQALCLTQVQVFVNGSHSCFQVGYWISTLEAHECIYTSKIHSFMVSWCRRPTNRPRCSAGRSLEVSAASPVPENGVNEHSEPTGQGLLSVKF